MRSSPKLFRENKYLIVLYTIPRWLRIAITAFFYGSLTILWLGFFFIQRKQKQIYFTNELRESNVRIKKLSDLYMQDKGFSEKIRKQKSMLHASYIGNKKKILHGVHDFLRVLEKNNIMCERIEPLGKKSSKWYEKECFNISVKGKFEKLISFFTQCKKMYPLMNVKQLSMIRDTEQNVISGLSLQIIKKVYE